MLAILPFSDIIWPALASPYFLPLFFPISILSSLIVEVVVMLWCCRSLVARWQVVVFTVIANLLSWGVGVLITNSYTMLGFALFPGADVFSNSPHAKFVTLIAVIGYLPATVLVEGFFYRAVWHRIPVGQMWRAVAISNCASYTTLLALMEIWRRTRGW